MHKNLLPTVHEYPVKIISGEGSYLITDDGRALLDFWGDEGVNSLGHNNPIVAKVLENVSLNHVPKMYACDVREKLAEKIAEFTGLNDYKVIFSNSGTEANEAAIKLSRVHWYKRNFPYKWNIATLAGNFHGRTGFSLASSDSSDSPYHKLGFGPMPVGFYKFHSFGNLREIAELPGGLSAIMMATVLGNNCIRTYPKEFFDELVKVSNESDAHIILDEVQVGMGRTGKNMAFHHYGFRPDIVTLGKGIAAGFPLSATVVSPEIAKTFEPGMHFNTFGGNIVSSSIALKVFEYVENNLEDINEKGKVMMTELQKHELIKYVSGMGMHLAFQIDYDKINEKMKKQIVNGYYICERALEKGLLIVTHRPYGEIRFTPPISASMRDIQKGITIVHEILDEL